MVSALAHITPIEVPTGVLLVAAGFFLGALATWVWQRFRVG